MTYSPFGPFTNDAPPPIDAAFLNALESAVQANESRADASVLGPGLTLWVGTEAQYNGLSSKSDTTVYVIT